MSESATGVESFSREDAWQSYLEANAEEPEFEEEPFRVREWLESFLPEYTELGKFPDQDFSGNRLELEYRLHDSRENRDYTLSVTGIPEEQDGKVRISDYSFSVSLD